MGILKGTHIRILPILLSRLLHALVSGVLTFVLLKSLGESVSVFAAQTHPIPVADPATPFLCLCLIMMGVLLLQQLSCPMQKKAFFPAVKSYFPKIYGKRIGKMV